MQYFQGLLSARRPGALLLICFCLTSISCHSSRREARAHVTKNPELENPSTDYGPAKQVGTININAITESSGLVASRTAPGIFWTHNDSGGGPLIYALDAEGNPHGVWRVTGASAIDWEDIAAGPGPDPGKSYLYIGDIGDNDSARDEVEVYRVLEPTPGEADAQTTKKNPRVTEPAETFRFRYPDGKHDAETLLVHPTTGNLYIITKIAMHNPTLYEAVAPLNSNGVTTLRLVSELNIPSFFGGVMTGGDISPDGKRVALCDYFQGYEFVLPKLAGNFDDIWKVTATTIDLGKSKQREGIAYRLDGRALLTSSEGRSAPLMEVDRK